MKKLIIKLVVVVVVLLVAVLIASMFFLGSIVKKGVETAGPPLTKTEMKLDSATLSLFSGTGSLKGFMLGNPEGFKTAAAVKVGTTSIGVSPRSVFADKVHVTHIRVEAPEITFESQGLNVQANNLSKILDNVKAATGPGGTPPPARPAEGKPGQEGASKKLQVDDFLITGSKLHLSSTLLAGQELVLSLPDVHFSNLGQGPEGITAAELTERVLAEVTAVAMKAAEKAIGEAASKGAAREVTDALKGLGKGSNTTDKVTKGVGDLLKKK